jgi:hypothetical protein
MPFRLCNAPGTFQIYINKALRQYLDDFCTAYFDDILIYSDNKEEYRKHVLAVLEILKKANLYLDIKKCEFGVKSVKYLSLIIIDEGIKIDPIKIKAIQQ